MSRKPQLTEEELTALTPFATVRQLEYIDAIIKHGSNMKAAKAMGLYRRTVDLGMNRLRAAAAIRGHSPAHDMTRTVPDGFLVKGVSTYYDKDGKPSGQWVKSAIDRDRSIEIVKEFVEHLATEARGMCPPIAAPNHPDSDLLAVIPMGDPHFGMYAWAKECGDDFDLKTAEELTCKAIDRLVMASPPADTGLLINLGDFFHADNSNNQTPASGHALDVDTRYPLVMQVGLRALVYCIKRMLERYKNVKFWMMPGNHDPHSSFAIALCVSAFFENEPRVEVDLNPSLYKYMKFGSVLIGAHHGHGARASELPGVMATDRAKDWGNTDFRYWYCGHIHHKFVDKEHPGVMVETFRTLAARDAWHSGKGYRAGRDMNLIIHHKKYGEIQRTRCDVSMLK